MSKGKKKSKADTLVRIQPRIPETLERRIRVHAASRGLSLSDAIASVLDSALPPLAEVAAKK